MSSDLEKADYQTCVDINTGGCLKSHSDHRGSISNTLGVLLSYSGAERLVDRLQKGLWCRLQQPIAVIYFTTTGAGWQGQLRRPKAADTCQGILSVIVGVITGGIYSGNAGRLLASTRHIWNKFDVQSV
jgi:hypothetical protein